MDLRNDPRLAGEESGIDAWWAQFEDPDLTQLIATAANENLTLRAAGMRILRARAVRRMAAGEWFPQRQEALGSFTRTQYSLEVTPYPLLHRALDRWEVGMNLAWEVDFWGRFRRAVEAADGELDASVADYHDVLVVLLAEVADNYVELRTFQARLALAKENVKSQQGIYDIIAVREKAGSATRLDLYQAELNLRRTESLIPELENGIRVANNRLCILLGLPPHDLVAELPSRPIPASQAPLSVGIPADLLRRRPDIRRAERLLAAQSARIGIAESELYPHFSLSGVISWQAEDFGDLFKGATSLAGAVGPSFRWNLLNYGRLHNAVWAEEVRFDELRQQYEQTVLAAQEEVENGIIGYLKARDRLAILERAVASATESEKFVLTEYEAGTADFNRVFAIQSAKVIEQDALARVQGEIAHQLIETYRALGGGWQGHPAAY